MAFSGVTSVRLTAAPGRIKRTEKETERGAKKRKNKGSGKMRQFKVEVFSR